MLPLALGAPGMLEWICASCSNPNMVFTAQVSVSWSPSHHTPMVIVIVMCQAEVRTGDGELVGQLRLLQSVPREDAGQASGPVMIDVSLNF